MLDAALKLFDEISKLVDRKAAKKHELVHDVLDRRKQTCCNCHVEYECG